MTKNLMTIRGKILLLISFFLLTNVAYSTTFRAVASGDFSNPATWFGGSIPPTTIITDVINISSKFAVNLDNNLTLDGESASLIISGTITTSNNSSLTIKAGFLQGQGIITVNTLNLLNSDAIVYFIGYIAADTINSSVNTLTYTILEAKQIFNVTAGTITFKGGECLKIGKDATILLNGGSFATEDGSRIRVANNYNVIYKKTTAITGTEATGIGLQHVTIDIDSNSSLTLTSDVAIGGTLSLLYGNLILNGNHLIINGSVADSGKGVITSYNNNSSITINSPNGTKGTLVFNKSGTAVKNLTVNVGTGSYANIDGSLSVNSNLYLKNGSLNFRNSTLTVLDTMSGTGFLSGNTSSNLFITTKNISLTYLNFAPGGQTVQDLTISVGGSNGVALVSPLTVTGKLSIIGESSFNLNGKQLILDNYSTVDGTGTFAANSASSLIINSTKGISALAVLGIIGNLTINTQEKGSDVTLSKDITVANILSLQSGSLVLNKHNLFINGNIITTTNGAISSDSNSNITIATAIAPTTPLKFSASANAVKKITLNFANGEMMSIGSDLHIYDTLNLKSGALNIKNNLLSIGKSGTILGSNNSSYIITEEKGALEMYVPTGLSNTISFPVGTANHFLPTNVTIKPGSEGRNIQVGVVNGVMAQGTSGTNISAQQSLVDATWNINSLLKENLNMNLQVQWTKVMEVNGFNRKIAYVSHYSNNKWDSSTTMKTAFEESDSSYSMIRMGITSLSPFAVFDNNTITEVTELITNSDIEILLNSFSNYITIHNNSIIYEPVNLKIYNSIGELIENYKLTDITSYISINKLIHGVYFITLSKGQKTTTKSFSKY